MKNIVIVGAGGFGREVFNHAEDCIRVGADWKIKGFIDDNLKALDNYDYPQKVIGTIKEYIPEENDFFICAIGSPKTKKIVVGALLQRGAKFEKLIHPSVKIGRNVKIGKGVVLCPNVTLTCDISIGNYAMVNCTSGCGHDSVIGDYCTISSYCDVTGFCKLGEGVFFASHVCMRPSSKVGDWTRVGINSCVIMNIKAGISAFGNPAVRI